MYVWNRGYFITLLIRYFDLKYWNIDLGFFCYIFEIIKAFLLIKSTVL